MGDTQFCFTHGHLQSQIQITATQGDKVTKSIPFGGGLSGIIPRVLGAPPARAFEVLQFDSDTFAITLGVATEIFHKGKFCKAFNTNPNGRLHIGADPKGTPLFLTSGPYRENLGDRPTDGWREYSLTERCLQ